MEILPRKACVCGTDSLKSGLALNVGALPQKLNGGAFFVRVLIGVEAVGPFQHWRHSRATSLQSTL